MCAFGIDKLCQHPAQILLLWRHGEKHAFRAHVPVKSLDIDNSETQFDLACRVLVRSWVQSESAVARHELTPAGRFELHCETEHIAVELHRLFHIGNELDRVPQMCSLHLTPLLMTERQHPIAPTPLTSYTHLGTPSTEHKNSYTRQYDDH